MSIEAAPETAEAARARQVVEVEALLVQSGVEVHALVMEQLRLKNGSPMQSKVPLSLGWLPAMLD